MTKRTILGTALAVLLSLTLILPVGAITPFQPDLSNGYFEGRASFRILEEDGSPTGARISYVHVQASALANHNLDVAGITDGSAALWIYPDRPPVLPSLEFETVGTLRGYVGGGTERRSRPLFIARLPYIGGGVHAGEVFIVGSLRLGRDGTPRLLRGSLTFYIPYLWEGVPTSLMAGTGRINLRWFEWPEG